MNCFRITQKNEGLAGFVYDICYMLFRYKSKAGIGKKPTVKEERVGIFDVTSLHNWHAYLLTVGHFYQKIVNLKQLQGQLKSRNKDAAYFE